METFNSTAAITWDNLASNIGGSLSLWIGITVMTVFEFVEFFIRLRQLAYAHIQETKELPVDDDLNGYMEAVVRAEEKPAGQIPEKSNDQNTALANKDVHMT